MIHAVLRMIHVLHPVTRILGPVIRFACALALLATIDTLNGCVVGPDYKPPAPADGADAPLISRTPTAETTAEPPDDWWRLYQDAVLDRLLQEAFAANADLRVAEANLSAARALLEAAKSGRYPQTKGEAAGTYGRDPGTEEILELGGHRPENLWVFDALLDVSYEIDLFGRVRRSVEASHADTAAKTAFALAHDQFIAGSLTSLELLITEQSLVAADAAVANSDAALVQDQVAVFKALGGGWRRP